ncbi:hypothetical protein WH5701_14071 [Synechococcus sp. WH 5701]|nr:hypothetical protein WH5701_14071 [Synechococcus sp. WH 5701]
MPKIRITATHLDLISFQKPIRDERLQGKNRIPAWYQLLQEALGIRIAQLEEQQGRSSRKSSKSPARQPGVISTFPMWRRLVIVPEAA